MTKIEYRVGDATRPKGDGTKVIAHICNDAGMWGAGFVVAVSKRWELPERQYRNAYRDEKTALKLGDVQMVKIPREYTVGEGQIVVANMVAQAGTGFRNGPPIRYDALKQCLGQIALWAMTGSGVVGFASVHMPRIGTGLAGGTWDKIEPLIEEQVTFWDVPVIVYDLPKRR